MLRITRCISLTSSLLIFSLTSSLCYIIADPAGYDDKKLYEYIKYALGIALVCPVKRYKNTYIERLELMFLSVGIGIVYL